MGVIIEEMNFRELPLEGTIPGSVALSRKPYFGPLNTPGNLECPRLEMIEEMKVKGYHAVPLETRGRVLGVLEVFDRKEIHRDSEWNDFLQTLAGQASLAIDVTLMMESLRESNRMIAKAYDQTLEVLARSLEMREMDTEEHSRRVISRLLLPERWEHKKKIWGTSTALPYFTILARFRFRTACC